MTCPCPSPHPGECPWVRVESEDEIKVGMALLWRNVGDIAIVLDIGPAQTCKDCGAHGPGTRLTDDPDWYPEEDEWNCITCDVVAADLYRLRDLPPDQAEETSAPVAREKARTT